MTRAEVTELVKRYRSLRVDLANVKQQLWSERVRVIILAMDPDDEKVLADGGDWSLAWIDAQNVTVILQLPHWKYTDSEATFELPREVFFGSDEDVAAFVADKQQQRDVAKQKQDAQLAAARVEKERKQEERDRAEYKRLQEKFNKD